MGDDVRFRPPALVQRSTGDEFDFIEGEFTVIGPDPAPRRSRTPLIALGMLVATCAVVALVHVNAQHTVRPQVSLFVTAADVRSGVRSEPRTLAVPSAVPAADHCNYQTFFPNLKNKQIAQDECREVWRKAEHGT